MTSILINRRKAVSVEDYLWSVQKYLMRMYGCDEAERLIYPLAWIIRTGRTSAAFDRKLTCIRPYVVGRSLAKGGSIDDAVRRIRDMVEAV